MRLILVRHGLSEGNERSLIQGHADYPLVDEGHRQATLIAQRLAQERIDHIYSSDLTRAKQTAEPIIRRHPKARVSYEPRLRERHYGAFENRSKPDVIARGAAQIGTWIAPPGGEHIHAFTERVTNMLDRLYAQHQGETVLVVSHSGVLTRFLLTLAGASDDEYASYRPHNASVSIIEFDTEKNHAVHLQNCTNHLRDTTCAIHREHSPRPDRSRSQ